MPTSPIISSSRLYDDMGHRNGPCSLRCNELETGVVRQAHVSLSEQRARATQQSATLVYVRMQQYTILTHDGRVRQDCLTTHRRPRSALTATPKSHRINVAAYCAMVYSRFLEWPWCSSHNLYPMGRKRELCVKVGRGLNGDACKDHNAKIPSEMDVASAAQFLYRRSFCVALLVFSTQPLYPLGRKREGLLFTSWVASKSLSCVKRTQRSSLPHGSQTRVRAKFPFHFLCSIFISTDH
ncbi:hypothetical protein DFH06DRAFT_720615 [Mycena polygramma]|nr:hypothetical protein DFH06DRAFT_720615 [Mycena polygramma]